LALAFLKKTKDYPAAAAANNNKFRKYISFEPKAFVTRT
jgi:hypothetical protein